MKRVFFVLLFISYALVANAFNPKEIIKQGNDLYSKNDFDGASKKYQMVIDSGFVSSELYYNLGNAYFKMHNIKSAILNYERAKVLNPGDKSIEFNLELARSFAVDKIEALPELFFVTWFKWVRSLFSANQWAIVSIFAFLIMLGAALLYLLTLKVVLKKVGFWIAFVALFASVSSFTFGLQLQEQLVNVNKAIVFTPAVTLKSSPSDTGNNLFILHEGTKVEILDRVGDWRFVSIADGNKGWLKITDIVVI